MPVWCWHNTTRENMLKGRILRGKIVLHKEPGMGNPTLLRVFLQDMIVKKEKERNGLFFDVHTLLPQTQKLPLWPVSKHSVYSSFTAHLWTLSSWISWQSRYTKLSLQWEGSGKFYCILLSGSASFYTKQFFHNIEWWYSMECNIKLNQFLIFIINHQWA